MTTNPLEQISHRHRFWCIVIMAMGTFILGITEFATMPMLPLIASSFNATPAEAGNVISAYAIGVVVGAPLLMLTTTKMNRRTALMLFAFLMFAANSLSSNAASLMQLTFFRFLSGLPHGAYFGTAFLLAADMAPKGKRANYMSRVFFGLTFATICGVPLVTLIGQYSSWRLCMLAVGVMALVTVMLLYLVLPSSPVTKPSNMMNELGVLKNKLVWSILGICIIGFGGVFCIYTYLADTILTVTNAPEISISIAMVLFGVGTTTGNWICGKYADQSPVNTSGIALIASILVSLCFVYAAYELWTLYLAVFCLGCSVGLAAVIQSMLFDASPDGHSMIGALVQCGFNTANAIGPWAGGLMLATGAAPNYTGYVAAMLFSGGFLMWLVSSVQIKRRLQPSLC
ncbi:MFS transporter [Alteromonas pelagimontana]|uniref:MFS transporter n=1 Tax=Alteromonas pelagimontana TaxID=1858656 RepID=A0A6M4MCH7_9ALTE|nr:MFS transporter [Alteromonas pelagimontana]QJR80360.1 MFS transporter [Alteromonas pelagimontana]